MVSNNPVTRRDLDGKQGFDFNYIVRLKGKNEPDDPYLKLFAERLFNKVSFKDKAVLINWDPRGDAGNYEYVKGIQHGIPPLGENTRLYFVTHGNIGENDPGFLSHPASLRYNIVNWNPNSPIAGFHGGPAREDMKISGHPTISSFTSAIARTKLLKTLGFPDKDEQSKIRRIGRVSIVACNTVDPDDYSLTGVEHHGFAKKLHQQLLSKGIETEVTARLGSVQVDEFGRKLIAKKDGRSTLVKEMGEYGKVIFRGYDSKGYPPIRHKGHESMEWS
jgi:hypothetical protein